jgi:AP-3 complex subunit mu
MPIYVKPQISWHGNSGKISVMVGTKSTGGRPVEDLVITIPFPKGIASTSLSANFGTVHYDDITKVRDKLGLFLSCLGLQMDDRKTTSQ